MTFIAFLCAVLAGMMATVALQGALIMWAIRSVDSELNPEP